MTKIRNFDSFWAVFPQFCPDKGIIWRGGAALQAKFNVYRGNVSPLGGENPILDL